MHTVCVVVVVVYKSVARNILRKIGEIKIHGCEIQDASTSISMKCKFQLDNFDEKAWKKCKNLLESKSKVSENVE